MNTHFKNFLLSTSIGLSFVIFFMVLQYLNGNVISMDWIKTSLVISASYTYPLYYVSAYSYDAIKNIGNRYQIPRWKSVLMGFPFVVILNIATIVLLQYVLKEFIFPDLEISFGNSFWNRIKVPLWISITIGAIFYIYNYVVAYNKAKLQNQTAQTSFITQKHEALKTQIGPHFLFNSLNVLSGLIDENTDKAQDFVANLAHVYRYVLDQKDKDWVKLSEEIQFAQTYLELIQTRFENGINIEIEEELADSNLMIAPLTLQLLLENCIKHNAISQNQPLQIHIYKENENLIIKNNLNPKKLNQNRNGTGLTHVNARYAELNEKIEILKTTTEFIVKIPLISKKIIQMKNQENFTQQEMEEAREEIKERVGFYTNLTSYIIFCGFLVGLNLYLGGYFFAIWPIMGWGIGVIFHALGTFYFNNKRTSAYQWQERQARKLLEKRKGYK